MLLAMMMMWYFTVCMGWCCPCILGWMIAKKLGENPLFYCLGMYVMPVLPLMRQRTREKYGITVRIWLFRFPNHNFWIFKLWSKRRKIEKKKLTDYFRIFLFILSTFWCEVILSAEREKWRNFIHILAKQYGASFNLTDFYDKNLVENSV